MGKLARPKDSFPKKQQGYGLVHLFAILISMVVLVRCMSSGDSEQKAVTDARSGSQSQSGATALTASEYLAEVEDSKKKKAAIGLDYERPVLTDGSAMVCKHSVLLEAAYDRRADGGLKAIYDARAAVWNRSEKIKGVGCEEWREGIRLFSVHRMEPPLENLVVFADFPGEGSSYFTWESELKNESLSSLKAQPGKVDQQQAFSPSSAIEGGRMASDEHKPSQVKLSESSETRPAPSEAEGPRETKAPIGESNVPN